jgi:hypothetical protein
MSATRRALRAAPALALLLCTGCGAHHPERQVVRRPHLPAALASELGGQSASIAARLDAGDACGALRLARVLQQQTIDAINRGRVPGAFQEPLQASVNDIAARIRCVPPAPKPKGHEKGKGHAGHKHGKRGRSD